MNIEPKRVMVTNESRELVPRELIVYVTFYLCHESGDIDGKITICGSVQDGWWYPAGGYDKRFATAEEAHLFAMQRLGVVSEECK